MRFGATEGLERRVLLSAWYVAPAGTDTNPGTLAQPFATIQHAANVARSGDTVFIRGGTYRETIKPVNSGALGAPIVYQSYNGESVTIDGADPITGWSRYQRRIYSAPQPWDLGTGMNQVFVDGRMMNEARWPNSGLNYSHPTTAVAQSVTNTPAAPAYKDPVVATLTMPSLPGPAGAWDGAIIHIAPGQRWVVESGVVTDSAPGTLTYSYQQLTPLEVPKAGDHFYLTGSFQALDSSNEWYRDPNTGKLYLWAPNGTDPATHVVEAKRRLYGFDLSGLSYIAIKGINLLACTINSDAASSYLTLDHLNAKYISHDLINPTPWELPFHPHTSGIILNGTHCMISSSVIQYSSGDGVFLGGSDNTAISNQITDTDYAGGDEAPVSTLGNNEQVLYNTIYNAGRSGVVHRFSGNAKILHNVIHDVGLQTTDCGGTYAFRTDGQGTEIAYNKIYNVHTGGFGGVGIFLDNSTSNFVVHHNVVWNCDAAMKMNPPSQNVQVYNNTFTGYAFSLATSGNADMTGSVFVNNIFNRAVQFGTGITQSNNMLKFVNPQFVDPAHWDFELQPTSPAIDAGVAVSPFTDGYTGAAPDLGAYEYGQPAFAAGAVIKPLTTPGTSRRDKKS